MVYLHDNWYLYHCMKIIIYLRSLPLIICWAFTYFSHLSTTLFNDTVFAKLHCLQCYFYKTSSHAYFFLFKRDFVWQYLYYYSSPVRKNLSSKFNQFLAERSQFDRDHSVNFYAHTGCKSATFGPLFAFYCPLFFTRKKLTMLHFARCDVYAVLFALDVATALQQINR